MPLSLDDIQGMPTDQDELMRHLVGRGLVTIPAAPPETAPMIPPATVAAPLGPVKTGQEVKPMTPPRAHENQGPMPPQEAPAGPHLELMGPPSQPVLPMQPPIQREEPPTMGGTPPQPTTLAPIIPSPAMEPLRKPTKEESRAAGKEEYYRDRPAITAAWGTPEYWQQVGTQNLWDEQHPLGGDISRMPGMKGKILHTLSEIGQTAGNIVAPRAMAEIPGTHRNRAEVEAQAANELERAQRTQMGLAAEKRMEAAAPTEEKLREAQIAETEKRTKEMGEPKTAAEQTFASLMSGGPGNTPQVNPDTKKPYTALEAYEALAAAGQKATTADQPLPQAFVDQANQMMLARWHVSHPNDLDLPAQFKLKPGATKSELATVDRLMEATEKAGEAKDAAAERHAQTALAFGLRQDAADEKHEKEERELVRVRDSARGVSYVEPLAKARAQKIPAENIEEVPATEKAPIQDARFVVYQINKRAEAPDQKGVLQLIDELDKDKKLGIVATKMNAWLSGALGTSRDDDPRIQALLNKGDLVMTMSMKAHFGTSGGRSPQMLAHFLQMANARTMDAQTMRAGFKAVRSWMQDKAEMPPEETTGAGGKMPPNWTSPK